MLALLQGEIRPAMVEAIRRCRDAGLVTACLTNNFVTGDRTPADGRPGHADVLELFAFVLESSKAGVRKPDPAFYELACEMAEVDPTEVVFLDDLGINLKPAKAMGMTTIKVVDPTEALRRAGSGPRLPGGLAPVGCPRTRSIGTPTWSGRPEDDRELAMTNHPLLTVAGPPTPPAVGSRRPPRIRHPLLGPVWARQAPETARERHAVRRPSCSIRSRHTDCTSAATLAGRRRWVTV